MINYFKLLLFIILILPVTWDVMAQKQVVEEVTLRVNNKPLIEVIEQLEANYSFYFRFKQIWIENKNVTVNISDASLEKTLQTIFYPLGINYLIRDKNLIVLLQDGSATVTVEREEKELTNDIIAIGTVTAGLKKASLSGKIIDGESKQPIVGTVVYTNSNSTVTDQFGNYNIELPVGINTINYQHKAYSDMSFVILLNSNGAFNLSMYESIHQLDEITISYEEKDANVTDVITGAETMSIHQIKKMPAMLGEVDLVRSILTLPGVNTVGEGVGGFNVRGSNSSQNLILLDDGILYNSSHLFGFFSAISADAVNSIKLYRGSIPSEFGGRIASALDIDLKSANKREIKGSGGIGIISSRFNIELPIQNEVSSLALSLRAAYPNWLIKSIDDIDLKNSSAFFGDFSLKYDHLLSEKQKISVSGYNSYDQFNLGGKADYQYNNTVTTINHLYDISQNLLNNSTFNYSRYQYSLTDRELENSGYQLDASINDLKLRTSFDYLGMALHEIKFGIEATQHTFAPGRYDPLDNAIQEPIQIEKEMGTEMGVFVSDKYRFTAKLNTYIGLRYSAYYGGKESLEKYYHGLEPRLSINYNLSPHSALKFGYNRMRQYVHLISNTTAVTPIDTWKLSNSLIKPTIADQISFGYFRNTTSNDYEFSSEAYFKFTNQIIDYRNGAELFKNDDIENEIIQGQGNAYGLELSFKKNTGKWNGWVNYTYSRSLITVDSPNNDESINQGEPYPTNFDQPHNLNLFSNIQLSRRFSLSTNFVYNTGRPVTVPESTYSFLDQPISHYSNRNNYRIPDYHRLDVTLFMSSNLKKYKKVEADWSITIYNIYGRKNVYSAFYRRNNQNTEAYKFIVIGKPILAISYNFKF